MVVVDDDMMFWFVFDSDVVDGGFEVLVMIMLLMV
jgi:hypothetical protein